MTAGRDLNRMLWAVGEAQRLRRAENPQPAGRERRRVERDDPVTDPRAGRPAR